MCVFTYIKHKFKKKREMQMNLSLPFHIRKFENTQKIETININLHTSKMLTIFLIMPNRTDTWCLLIYDAKYDRR